jgi:hypothetical protein
MSTDIGALQKSINEFLFKLYEDVINNLEFSDYASNVYTDDNNHVASFC